MSLRAYREGVGVWGGVWVVYAFVRVCISLVSFMHVCVRVYVFSILTRPFFQCLIELVLQGDRLIRIFLARAALLCVGVYVGGGCV